MTRPVSIVIPALDDLDLFQKSLPPLLAEIDARGLGDEVIVVDDTGRDALSGWMEKNYPSVQVLARAENGGYAAALLSGVREAAHELAFSMNPDVIVRRGFLDPLVACIEPADVHSVVPQILLNGDREKIESVTEVFMRAGLGEVRQRGLEGIADRLRGTPFPVAYGVGGACLMRKQDFLATDGYDPLYEPFYWEDVDLGWSAWREGKRVIYQPASIVEHHHRGTIGKRVKKDMVRAVIEKNRLLFQWKFIDDDELLEEHLAALYRWAVDAWISDERDELVWIALALDQVQEVLAARKKLDRARRGFAEIRRETTPEVD